MKTKTFADNFSEIINNCTKSNQIIFPITTARQTEVDSPKCLNVLLGALCDTSSKRYQNLQDSIRMFFYAVLHVLNYTHSFDAFTKAFNF